MCLSHIRLFYFLKIHEKPFYGPLFSLLVKKKPIKLFNTAKKPLTEKDLSKPVLQISYLRTLHYHNEEFLN